MACLSCITNAPAEDPLKVAPPGSLLTVSLYPIMDEVAALLWSNNTKAFFWFGSPAPSTSDAKCNIEDETDSNFIVAFPPPAIFLTCIGNETSLLWNVPTPIEPLWYILSVKDGWNCACAPCVSNGLTQSSSPIGVVPINVPTLALVKNTFVAVKVNSLSNSMFGISAV